MNWEHTHLTMAPGAGKVEQLRGEATAYRRSRDLLKETRSHRAHTLRDRLTVGIAATVNDCSRVRNLL